MGMCDTILILEDVGGVACPEGHRLRSFQTKDLEEPSMRTYLVRGGRLYLASPGTAESEDEQAAASWRFEGDDAVQVHRFRLQEIVRPRSLRVYASCRECEPVLVRTEQASLLGDLVCEHQVFVDLLLTFRSGEPLQIERTSGAREDMKQDLRARGLCVLNDDEPLAVAHREVRKARQRSGHRAGWF